MDSLVQMYTGRSISQDQVEQEDLWYRQHLYEYRRLYGWDGRLFFY